MNKACSGFFTAAGGESGRRGDIPISLPLDSESCICSTVCELPKVNCFLRCKRRISSRMFSAIFSGVNFGVNAEASANADGVVSVAILEVDVDGDEGVPKGRHLLRFVGL